MILGNVRSFLEIGGVLVLINDFDLFETKLSIAQDFE